MSTDRSQASTCKYSSFHRSTHSADDVVDRRRYRSMVPRRILFPQDYTDEVAHGDSFDQSHPVTLRRSF